MRAFGIFVFLFLLLASLGHGCVRRSGNGAGLYAQRLHYMVGRNFGPLQLKSIEAENDVLVVTFDGPEGWRRGTPSYVITAYFLEGFCKAPDAAGYLVAGRTLRLDSYEAGRSLIRGTPVRHCPHP